MSATTYGRRHRTASLSLRQRVGAGMPEEGEDRLPVRRAPACGRPAA